jgi:threonylcarbamoyladenosine tRNA methylthiotransferase MtaB
MRLYLDSVGCRLNQAEIADLGYRLRAQGHSLVASPSDAEIMVLNTCTVTAKAASDSRWRVWRAYRCNPHLRVLLTGCWVTLEGEQASALPGVWKVIPNARKSLLAEELLGLPVNPSSPAAAEMWRFQERNMRTRAHIGIQEGCDRHCTYCLTRAARGPLRSEPVGVVIERVERASESGAKEVVLSGVQIGAYGRDLPGAITLESLLREILRRTTIPRIRLSSLEPWDLTGPLLSLWADPRLCPHLHLPLQSGCGATLRRMARPIEPSRFRELLSEVRTEFPDMAITTDLMVGFPGESEAEFEESLSYVEEMGFAGGHVFTFSPRPGTPAASMRDRVQESVMSERSRRMRGVIARSCEGYFRGMVGRTLPVLWESGFRDASGRWNLLGHADNHAWVSAPSPENLRNHLSEVLVERVGGRGLQGRICAPSGAGSAK